LTGERECVFVFQFTCSQAKDVQPPAWGKQAKSYPGRHSEK